MKTIWHVDIPATGYGVYLGFVIVSSDPYTARDMARKKVATCGEAEAKEFDLVATVSSIGSGEGPDRIVMESFKAG